MKSSRSGLLNKTAISSLLLTFALVAENPDLYAAPDAQQKTEHGQQGLFTQMNHDRDNKNILSDAMRNSLEKCIVIDKKDGSKTVLSCPFAIPHPGRE